MSFGRLGQHFLAECWVNIFDIGQHDGLCWDDMSFWESCEHDITPAFPTESWYYVFDLMTELESAQYL